MWEVGVAYRRLTADEWLVGRTVQEDKAPFGQPLYLDINTVDLVGSHGITDRLSATVSVPLSHGTHSRYYGDGARHEVSAAGLGDITATTQWWFWNPATHFSGNIAVGAGVKTPTGRNDVIDNWYVPGGSIQHTVDQSIQLGDGGWGIVLQAQGWRSIFGSGSLYGFGSYLISPRNYTDVIQAPAGLYSRVHVTVPDVFQTRAGVGFPLSTKAGLTLTAGGRFEGIPMGDLAGGSDGFRRPALIGYADLGMIIVRGRATIGLNVPIRVFADFRPSRVDKLLGSPGGGDLADYIVLAGYTYRFGGRRAKASPSQSGC